MSNNNDKDRDINNVVEDNYDYLDDLMTDILEEDNIEEVDVDSSSSQSTKVEKDIIKEEEEVVKPRRRAPLLAQFFNEEGEDTSIEDKKEDIVIEDNALISNKEQVEVKDNLVISEQERAEVTSTPSKSIHSGIKKGWENAFIEEELEEEEEEEEEEEDNFESMFADLVDIGEDNGDDIEDNNSLKGEEKLDNEVIIPLQKPGMEDIIVTPDGRSLAEVIPNIRGGTRKSHEVLADIKEQKRVVKVDEKKFSDNRYTKHIEIAEERKEDREERARLSRNYLQKHARFTEQEKTILNNLGLSSEEFGNIISSKELSKKDKEEIIGLGRYGPEKHFKGKRYRTTMGDMAILDFLVKFKFANTRILRWLSNESQNTTFQKLRRLEKNGLIESQSIIGIPDLWGATTTGIGLAGYHLKPGLRPMPKMQTISSSMGVNYLAACLWFNSVNVLNLEDFPASNRLMGLENGEFKRVKGEDLVSELEIRSSLGREINPYSSTVQNLEDERLYDVISANVRKEFEEWVSNGKQGLSPEVLPGNEYMWVLYPTSQLTLSYHVPDLVVNRERGPNGEPRSIAVELERHTKTNDRYDKIMLAYKLDEHLYEKVIWVTPNARSARALDLAAQSVGFDRYEIIPIITETGIYNKSDIWLI